MKFEFTVKGMHCASCIGPLEDALKNLKGVKDVSINFTTSFAVVEIENEHVKKYVLEAVKKAGYVANSKTNENNHSEQNFELFRLFSSILFTIPLFVQMFWQISPTIVQAILATFVQIFGGWKMYKGAFHSLKSFRANMDTLIVIGTTSAYLFSLTILLLNLDKPLYFDTSAMIITLVLFGQFLELRSKIRASEALKKLLQLQPKNAKVKRGKTFVEIPIEAIKKGDLFMVRPFESVPVDGKVVEGTSTVNESMITGESLPVEKKTASSLFAATVNQNGVLIAEAIKLGNETVLATIIQLVKQAQNSKAPVQRLADRIASIFVPVVIGISMVTFLGWLLYGETISASLIYAVAVLVIACPCAIGLATPTVIVVASGKGASLGILFREVTALERAKNISTLILDKTGTMTEGKPRVTKIEGKREEVLKIANALEQHSQHPLALAIQSFAKNENTPLLKVTNFITIPGKGIKAQVEGVNYTLGSSNFAKEEGVKLDSEADVFIWKEHTLLGSFTISDPLKQSSVVAIDRFNQMGLNTVMLTGDRKQTAEKIAKESGVKEYEAEVLPQDKAKKIKQFTPIVAMVGDGINDAPALAAADVSFAIGAGSDIAIESSDITLMKNDLNSVVEAIELSQATFKKIRQNLFFALIYNALGIPLAAFGYLNPIIAAAAMAMSSICVISNALLLKRWNPKQKIKT